MRPRVAFVYPNRRTELAAQVAAGAAPDTTLLGQNHLAVFDVDARIVDSVVTRPRLRPAPLHRVAWNLRDLTVPFEVGRVDAVFTPLANLLPLAARARGLGVVVLNFGLCVIYERASRLRKRLLVSSLSGASSVICCGSAQRELLLAQTGLDPARVPFIRLGVDERYFSPRPPPDGADPFVLAVGKDLARDYATLADALPGFGVRAEVAAYAHNIAGLQWPGGSRAGPVPIGELRDLYARAAVVTITQYRDGYPYGAETGGITSFLEAAAMGKAIVATDRGAMRDYAVHGENALLVPPEDSSALREAIATVLADPGLAARLGAAARRRVEQEGSTRHFAAAIAPLLREAAA